MINNAVELVTIQGGCHLDPVQVFLGRKERGYLRKYCRKGQGLRGRKFEESLEPLFLLEVPAQCYSSSIM